MTRADAVRLIERAEGLGRLEPGALAGRSRLRAVVRVRAMAVWALWELTLAERASKGRFAGLSFTAIGQLLGGRDHSTVIHLLDKARGLMKRDPAFAARAEWLAGLRPQALAPLPEALVAAIPQRGEGGEADKIAREAARFLARRRPLRDVARTLDDPEESDCRLQAMVEGSIRLRLALNAARGLRT